MVEFLRLVALEPDWTGREVVFLLRSVSSVSLFELIWVELFYIDTDLTTLSFEIFVVAEFVLVTSLSEAHPGFSISD